MQVSCALGKRVVPPGIDRGYHFPIYPPAQACADVAYTVGEYVHLIPTGVMRPAGWRLVPGYNFPSTIIDYNKRPRGR